MARKAGGRSADMVGELTTTLGAEAGDGSPKSHEKAEKQKALEARGYKSRNSSVRVLS